MVIKTIGISEETKLKMDKHKIHPRETYEDLILRLIENDKKQYGLH